MSSLEHIFTCCRRKNLCFELSTPFISLGTSGSIFLVENLRLNNNVKIFSLLTASFFFSSRFLRYCSCRSIIRMIASFLRSSRDMPVGPSLLKSVLARFVISFELVAFLVNLCFRIGFGS